MARTPVAFDDLITFTRSTAGGTINSAGIFELVPANKARFDFDPVSKIGRGILVEEQRTNLFIYSNKIELLAKNSGATSLANAGVSPDGANDAARITFAGNASSGVYRPSITTPGQLSCSVYAKSISGNGLVRFIMEGPAYGNSQWGVFDIINGKVMSVTGSIAAYIEPGPLGYWRIQVTRPVINTGTPQTSMTIYSGDVTTDKVIDLWGGQVEVGTVASTHIPTAAAQVTRAADSPLLNTISPWFNNLQGSILVDFMPAINRTTAFRIACSIDDGTVNNRLQMYEAAVAGNAEFRATTNGVGTSIPVIAAAFPPSIKFGKIGLAFSNTGLTGSANGKSSLARANFITPTVSFIRLGTNNANGQQLNGRIQKFRYIPHRLTNEQMQVATS